MSFLHLLEHVHNNIVQIDLVEHVEPANDLAQQVLNEQCAKTEKFLVLCVERVVKKIVYAFDGLNNLILIYLLLEKNMNQHSEYLPACRTSNPKTIRPFNAPFLS